jgi:hypothetical protein
MVVAALPDLAVALRAARRRALHIEMRDTYEITKEIEARFAGAPAPGPEAFAEWHDLLSPLVTAGGDLRRLRIVSEPITDYVRFEHEDTPAANLAAGEIVRWIPRDRASDLRLPGNDFWLVDDTLLFNLASGDGDWLGIQRNDDPDVLAFCLESFEAAWLRGIDHADYRPA